MENKITKVRLNHVAYGISDDRFKSKFSGNTKDYQKGTELTPFPVEVWSVAETIFKHGIDPVTLKKKAIEAWGDYVLLGGACPVSTAQPPVAVNSQENEAAPAVLEEESPTPVAPTKQIVTVNSTSAKAEEESSLDKLTRMPVRLSITTLLHSALALMPYYHREDAAKVKEKLEELIKLMHPAATNSAKND